MYTKTSCPFSAERLASRAVIMTGWPISEMSINKLMQDAQDFCEDYEWEEGQGFGSSDFTFALKEFVDGVLPAGYKTVFNPCLSIIKA